MRSILLSSAAVLLTVLSGAHAAPPPANPASQAKFVQLSVLSSPSEYVSGGDARIGVRAAPGLHDKIELYLNGSRVNTPLWVTGSHQLEGVIQGLLLGENTLEVYVKGQSLRDSITLTNYPITGPMFSGSQQQPFVCTTNQGAVGKQPLVDSATPPGYRVTDAGGATIGYSRNCSIDSLITYQYRSTANGSFKPYTSGMQRPADIGAVKIGATAPAAARSH